MLVAEDLFRFFHSAADEVIALRGVSINVDEGEIVAVVGPSGSGKSTLLACLAGLDDPDGGQVTVAGERLSHQPESVRAAIRARLIGVLFQERNLFEHLTIGRNVSLGLLIAGVPSGSDADSLLEDLGLGGHAHSFPSQLSGGEAVRAGLAVALAKKPRVLLADEPTAELDSLTEQSIADIFRNLADRGAAVVVATHSEQFARTADRIVRMRDGEVVDG